jgi:hypothetical protein
VVGLGHQSVLSQLYLVGLLGHCYEPLRNSSWYDWDINVSLHDSVRSIWDVDVSNHITLFFCFLKGNEIINILSEAAIAKAKTPPPELPGINFRARDA